MQQNGSPSSKRALRSPRVLLATVAFGLVAGAIALYFVTGPGYEGFSAHAPEQGRDAPEQGRDAPERIVLVTVDTLRRDHLGAYGYRWSAARFLDELADSSAVFEQAVVSMATTAPSHASMLTSLYPTQHRVLKNGHVMPESATTLAELLDEHGFATYGSVSTDVHFRAGNIDQGFDFFDEPSSKEGDCPGTEPPTHNRIEGKYRVASRTIDGALRCLDHAKEHEKFLLWVHLFDPHVPLTEPRQAHRSLEQLHKPKAFKKYLIDDHHTPRKWLEERDLLRKIQWYDAEIAYMDAQLERLYQAFESRGLNERSIWVVTADHGEGLGNHQWFGHGKHIYNEQVLVPLIVHFPGHDTSRRIPGPVETIDIMPTLLSMLGLESELPQMARGRSLLPFLQADDERQASTGYALSQRRAYAPRKPSHNHGSSSNYEEGEKLSLQSSEHKLIWRTAGPDELYDLGSDPYELENLAGTGRPEEEVLLRKLRERVSSLAPIGGKPDDGSRKPTDDVAKRLRSLGYVQ